MATITIDGADLSIHIGYDGPITEVSAVAVYSAWKEWVLAGNAQYPPAFGESIGGNDLGAGLVLDSYLFIRNDLGWSIVGTAMQDYEIRIQGNLYPFNPAIPFLDPAEGGYSFSYILQRSSATQVVSTNSGALTPNQDALLTLIGKILRNRRETDPVTGTQRIYDDDGVTVLIEGDLFEDVAGTTPYNPASQKVDRADRMS